MKNKRELGMTFVEVLLYVGLMAISTGMAAYSLTNYQGRVKLDEAALSMLGNLRVAQQNAVSQEESSDWGIYINAVSGAKDYYKIFYGDSFADGVMSSMIDVDQKVEFTDPPQGEVKEIIFERLTGYPVSATTTSMSLTGTLTSCKILEINSYGNITLHSNCYLPSTHDLIGYWKFDEGGGLTATSTFMGVDGTWNGSGTHYTAGKVGTYAGQFNGIDDFLYVSDATNVFDVSYMTVMGWMYKTSNAAGHHTVVSRGGASFIVNFYSSTFEIYFYTTGGTCLNPGVSYASLLNGWHHFAATYDGADNKLYIDGSLVRTQSGCSGTINTSANGLFIGSRSAGSASTEANLDEIAIYSRALSPAEIYAAYYNGK
ncbi:MAG: hypothetical protein PHN74_02675 [Candidatus Pacebacteria bacterium]|nr:hypothetical protein [Candidatus Paceibacterota bacterium]